MKSRVLIPYFSSSSGPFASVACGVIGGLISEVGALVIVSAETVVTKVHKEDKFDHKEAAAFSTIRF
jgi:hypothetical protein